ncbi:MAG TPA: hypothetical protein VEI49_02615 [Terriglobales bacterium]|nr:hypothetical protein [Terriglobales bacterium]
MNSLAVSMFVFVAVFVSAIAGLLLRGLLPEQHLSAESKRVIQLGMGLVGTMTALVLGLLVASAKGSFDAQSTEITQASANVILLDRLLGHYGPETKEIREDLRSTLAHVLEVMWSENRHGSAQLGTEFTGSEILYEKIHNLSPQNDLQRTLQLQASNLVMNLAQTRWLLFEQGATSVSKPMLIVMLFWLAIIFMSWGLFAPPNATVIATLLVAALSVSSAIFLILEMYSPYSGLIQVSSAPLRVALAQLGH